MNTHSTFIFILQNDSFQCIAIPQLIFVCSLLQLLSSFVVATTCFDSNQPTQLSTASSLFLYCSLFFVTFPLNISQLLSLSYSLIPSLYMYLVLSLKSLTNFPATFSTLRQAHQFGTKTTCAQWDRNVLTVNKTKLSIWAFMLAIRS